MALTYQDGGGATGRNGRQEGDGSPSWALVLVLCCKQHTQGQVRPERLLLGSHLAGHWAGRMSRQGPARAALTPPAGFPYILCSWCQPFESAPIQRGTRGIAKAPVGPCTAGRGVRVPRLTRRSCSGLKQDHLSTQAKQKRCLRALSPKALQMVARAPGPSTCGFQFLEVCSPLPLHTQRGTFQRLLPALRSKPKPQVEDTWWNPPPMPGP